MSIASMYVYVCMIGKLRIDRVLMPAQPSQYKSGLT